MAIRKSDIEDRRREDSEMPTINKKRKHGEQKDHLDEQDQNSRLELILLETDMTSTIQSEDKSEYLSEEVIEVDEQSVENEIFNKYLLEEIEINKTEEQQINDETRNETTVQRKMSYKTLEEIKNYLEKDECITEKIVVPITNQNEVKDTIVQLHKIFSITKAPDFIFNMLSLPDAIWDIISKKLTC
ncbi:22452_t:CDS:2 [Gigaspora margarita]|uniref:22452_t:CDS:1 n=1 Tax=Gigaspora margarita TaxID=4874 RepID=A0ABN7VKU0_GIGMA|nr:22452_t:CDS:2 [Gigaspora margarita]